MQPRPPFSYLALLALLTACAVPIFAWAQVGPDQDRYIVILKDGPGIPEDVAADVSRRSNGRVGYVYANALRGFSITLPRAALAGVARNPHVAYVEEDLPVGIVAQTLPTGVDRIFRPLVPDSPETTGSIIDKNLSIDGINDWRVDVDVAVLDTGIDLEHPELNVVGGTNCMQSTGSGPPWKRSYYCDDTEDADDDHYHGTHVAGTIGAIDNGVGVVGVAPGARLYAVKVLDSNAEGWASSTLAGIDWVVAQGDIKVMNMSLGGSGQNLSYVTAIDNAVAAGVVVVVAASNSDADANDYSPAFVQSAITVSALADFDGIAGGDGSSTCSNDQDDTLWDFSNWGTAIDIAAPGVCILSTFPLEQGEYGTLSGTSMATPNVAGAAALLASGTNSPQNADDVQEIRDALVGTGNFDWVDDSGDGIQEPLLDVSTLLDDPTFTVEFVPGDEGNGGANDPPTASFTHDDCVAGQSCLFDASSSDDSDGTIDAYDWDFDAADNSTDATGAAASYTFTSSDAYTVVTLTVTDNEGATDSDTQMVSVSSGGSGTPDACDGLGNGVHLTPSSTNQKRTWTAIVDALNCIGEDVASFESVSLSWFPEVGTVTDCSTSTGVCQATQSGIRKKTGSVQFTLNGSTTMVSKP